MNRFNLFAGCAFITAGCGKDASSLSAKTPDYFDDSTRVDVVSGGARRIEIQTPRGPFKVWTKRIGNSPTMKVLLLHGGPGITHEYLEAFDSYFPAAGIEYYYYDQLGSAFSDQPDFPDLWDLSRFVEEVEQVRQALGLDAHNFYLFGQSWGGLLAMEYALKYQRHLKGLIVSNMMSSVPAYNDYVRRVLVTAMDQDAVREIMRLEEAHDYDNPRYMELLIPQFYTQHVLRMPVEQWPDPVQRAFGRLNRKIYVPMQGPSKFGASGKLALWDRTAELGTITVPTLTIGATYDTMDPAWMRKMAGLFKNGRYHDCPNGSHLALYDDQKVFFSGLIDFIRHVERDHR